MRSSSYKPSALSNAQSRRSSNSARSLYFGSLNSFVHVRARGRLPGGFAGETEISAEPRPPGGSLGQAVTNSRNWPRRSGVRPSSTSTSMSRSEASKPPFGRRCLFSSSLDHSTWPPQNKADSSDASKAQMAEEAQTSSTPCLKAETCGAMPSRNHQYAAFSTNSSKSSTVTERLLPPSQSSAPPTPVSQNVMQQVCAYSLKLQSTAAPSVQSRNSLPQPGFSAASFRVLSSAAPAKPAVRCRSCAANLAAAPTNSPARPSPGEGRAPRGRSSPKTAAKKWSQSERGTTKPSRKAFAIKRPKKRKRWQIPSDSGPPGQQGRGKSPRRECRKARPLCSTMLPGECSAHKPCCPFRGAKPPSSFKLSSAATAV
mmetsp:Transcript_68760/g.223919  ORF Transcript_68760/g.223919 Transcript_68760/m.223919 type:complete len:371 (-) Transcript_68760:3229-4341(-)